MSALAVYMLHTPAGADAPASADAAPAVEANPAPQNAPSDSGTGGLLCTGVPAAENRTLYAVLTYTVNVIRPA